MRNILFEDQRESFFLSLGQQVYIFEESAKSIQDVIGDVYCPGKYCSNREKCESIYGYVTTPRYIYGCGKCGAWLFVHKVSSTLQEHVKTTKTDKTRFFFAIKKTNLVPNKQLLVNAPFQSTKYRKKELCVENIVRETIGDVFCPLFRNEQCVHISTKKTTNSYDFKNCKACCHVLKVPFKDHKPRFMLFGGVGTHCLSIKMSRDYAQKSHLHF